MMTLVIRPDADPEVRHAALTAGATCQHLGIPVVVVCKVNIAAPMFVQGTVDELRTWTEIYNAAVAELRNARLS